MNTTTNKYIAVAYKLYANDGKGIIEEATDEQPFIFISGLGFALDEFENRLTDLKKGATFDFTLTKEQAYGCIDAGRIVDIDKQKFFVDGKFDDENVYPDAIIPLQNAEGMRFNGRVAEVGDNIVKIDLNHPLAGKALHFTGHIVESRNATGDEIQQTMEQMGGKHHCGGCGGHCNHHHEGEHECCHGSNDCCGHCNEQ